MKDSMDGFVEKLEEKIFEESKETYGEEVFSRWQNPRLMGRVTDASSVGRITGPCGDTMEISLQLDDDLIKN